MMADVKKVTSRTKPTSRATKKTAQGSSPTGETDAEVLWNLEDVLSDIVCWEKWAVKNTINLLDEENTIPFIARYRKEKTNNMEADKIREVKSHLDELRAVQAKISSVKKSLDKQGMMTSDLSRALRQSQTLAEVDHLYAPFKPGSKRTLAQRARDAGLEPIAMAIIKDPHLVNLHSAVIHKTEGRSSLSEVEKGVQHILADVISKDKEVMDMARKLVKIYPVSIECSRAKSTSKAKVDKQGVTSSKPSTSKKTADASKFQNYFEFRNTVKNVRPHQILAINRGEKMKVLSVKISLPNEVQREILRLAVNKYTQRHCPNNLQMLIVKSAEDAFSRLIEPLMIRNVRADLTKIAEQASVDVFKSNLRRLLLTPPVRGKVILGLDPGFTNGCKYAISSKCGDVLDTGVVYLHGNRGENTSEVYKLTSSLIKHKCENIAVGNGVACRQTEAVLAKHIQNGTFKPLNPMYCIVSESGASIYSASDEAQKELPHLDITLRGAVSIARRLQDPLAELVKIEPKHIGVGMYQHDINEGLLKVALEGVVEDCVSFVGVDLNVCSELLLRRVAGLNKSRAEKIVQWRHENGGFFNREQLRTIKGLGPKTYEQCSGFVRILPETTEIKETCPDQDVIPQPTTASKTNKRKAPPGKGRASKKAKLGECCQVNPLDRTNIHPESYAATDSLLKSFRLNKEEIGKEAFIISVKQAVSNTSVSDLASQHSVGVPTMELILKGLQQSVHADIRDEFEKPLFKQKLTSLSSLRPGALMTGKVSNATHFGAFVDVGVETDGLIHSSKMHAHLLQGKSSLELGDRVRVKVLSVEKKRGRLGLELMELM